MPFHYHRNGIFWSVDFYQFPNKDLPKRNLIIVLWKYFFPIKNKILEPTVALGAYVNFRAVVTFLSLVFAFSIKLNFAQQLKWIYVQGGFVVISFNDSVKYHRRIDSRHHHHHHIAWCCLKWTKSNVDISDFSIVCSSWRQLRHISSMRSN